MPGVMTCLWFEKGAAEAARFYVETFRACGRTADFGDGIETPPGSPGPTGEPLTVTFRLDGHTVMGLNGGSHYTLTPAASLVVECADQAEVDRFWGALLAGGGTPSRCGWLTDRFGLSWQVVPKPMIDLLKAGDGAANGRMMGALMGMVKLDLAALEAAHRGDASGP